MRELRKSGILAPGPWQLWAWGSTCPLCMAGGLATCQLPPMPLRCRSTIPLALVFLLLVGTSGGVQLAAWVGMVTARTPLAGWDRALRSTFSGESPCCLCRAAKALSDGQPDLPGIPGPGDMKVAKADLGLPATDHQALRLAPRSPHPRSQIMMVPAGTSPAPEPPPPRSDAGLPTSDSRTTGIAS